MMNFFIIFICALVINDAFFNRTGLERVGNAGPELKLSLGRSACAGVGLLCKNKKEKGSAGASYVTAPIPKSIPSC